MNKNLLVKLAIGFLIVLCGFGVGMMLHVVFNVNKFIGVGLLAICLVLCFLFFRGMYKGRRFVEDTTTLITERVVVVPLDCLKLVDNPDPSQEMLIDEYTHLNSMVESLLEFIKNDPAYGALDAFERNALIKQWNLMAGYLHVLAGRMAHKQILVPDFENN